MSTAERIAVMQAADEFVARATAHPSTPEGYAFIVGEPGKKYTRIVMTVNGRSNSVHAFIDNANGDLYKAAGWKAPAKHVRGNIVTGLDDIMARFTWSGGYLYLR